MWFSWIPTLEEIVEYLKDAEIFNRVRESTFNGNIVLKLTNFFGFFNFNKNFPLNVDCKTCP